LKGEVLIFLARRRGARGEFRVSREYIHEFYRMHGARPPSELIEPYVNVLLGQTLERLGDLRSASRVCMLAVEQLKSRLKKDWNYNIDDVNYLLYCCKVILSRTTNYADSPEFMAAKAIQVRYEDLNVGKVQRRIANTFSISPDLGKEYDEYIKSN
jgi:hypothetical protein